MDINAVSCIKGEIHSIMTLMRLNTKWAKSKLNRQVVTPDENSLVQSFRVLIEYLEGMFDIRDVDVVMYVQPFHQVIVSEHASGPLTIAAVTALSKFALYGFLDAGYPNANNGINMISNAICRCVFEETDWESDEVVLMKLLELSTMTMRCDASSHLTVKAAWDIYSTCISIHNQYRASKILKSEAATALRHLTLTVFGRAHSTLRSPLFKSSEPSTEFLDTEDFGFTDNMKGSSWEKAAITQKLSLPLGVTLLFGKVMTILSNLMDPQGQTGESVKFALSLVNIALEAGGPALGTISPLVDVLRGDVCRHLLRATQNDDLAVFSLSLRAVFNMFMSIKDHMKVQLEVFLTSVHLRLLQSNNVSSIPAREELALESLLEFCREPALMHDLYTNYDCDVQCTNLFDSIISTLCTRAIPLGLQDGIDSVDKSKELTKEKDLTDSMAVNILNRLALYGVLSVLHAVSGREKCSKIAKDFSLAEKGPTQEPMSSAFKSVSGGTILKSSTSRETVSPDSHFKRINSTPTRDSSVDSLESQVDRWCDAPLYPVTPDSQCFADDSTSSTPTDELYHADLCSTPSKDEDENRTSESLSSPPSPIFMSRPDIDVDTDFVILARARTADMLRQRKMRKQRLKMAAEKFNEKPLKIEWILFAAELGLLPKSATLSATESVSAKGTVSPSNTEMTQKQSDAKAVAKFLKNTPGLGKTQIGEYLGKGPKDIYPFTAMVLTEYVNTFDFSGNSSIDKAMRLFLGHFKLPGEAQCIDRLMESFAGRLFEFLGPGKPFKSKDAAFVLAFSVIMLNTDLHNPQVQDAKRMTKDQFVRNNRGINDGDDLPRAYLESLYDQIKERQIQVDFDIGDAVAIPVDYSEMSTWDALLRKSAADQAPAAFTPTLAARQWLRRSGVLRPSVHDRDMFLVMAKPVVKTVLLVWESTDDDKLIFRMLEGLLDYAAACVHFELMDMLEMLVRLLVQRIKSTVLVPQITQNKGKVIKEQFVPMKTSEVETFFGPEFECIISQRRLSKPRDLPKGSSFDQLTDKKSNPVTFSPQQSAYVIRAELMLKTTLEIISCYCGYFEKNCWTAVIDLFIWARSHKLLPRNALLIDDFADKGGNLLPLSQAAFRCSDLERGRLPLDSDTQGETNKTTGIWGFFFDKGIDEEVYVPKFDKNGQLLRGEKEFGLVRGKSITDTSPSSLDNSIQPQFDEYVKSREVLSALCLHKCNVFELIFEKSLTFSDDALMQFTTCLISFIRESLANIHTAFSEISKKVLVSPINQKPDEPAKRLSRENVPIVGINELDAILALEWISRLVCLNKSRSGHVIWPVVHDFMCSVFDEKIDMLIVQAPFLVERFVVTILRSSIYLCTTNKQGSSFNMQAHAQVSAVSSTQDSCSSSFWSSLRLLRGLHNESIYGISERLGVGLYFLLQAIIKENIDVDLEQWYLIFSLLSAATSTLEGQKYVFDGLNTLIENNCVNDINFTPCRHLTQRFLHRTFPGVEGGTNRSNPWETQTLTCLMRLTLMALGGYHETLKDSSSKRVATKYMTFPLPVETVDSFQKTLHSIQVNDTIIPLIDGGSVSPTTETLLKKNSSTQITVVCVSFSKIEEVELLWTEACKIFSDVVSSEPLSSSKQIIFLMQTIFMAGRITQLPKSTWLKAVSEMLQRLPIDLKIANERFSNSDVIEICDVSLRCCNIVFEVLVTNFRQLLSSKEFSAHWLMFLGVLSSNLKIANRGLPIFEETIEMVGALLRLLRPLPVAAIASPSSSDTNPQGGKDKDIAGSPLVAAEAIDTSQCVLPATVSFENFEEDSLLRESWKIILQINPSIPQLLLGKHPKIVADMTTLTKNPLTKQSSNELLSAQTDSLQSDETSIPKKQSGVFAVFGF